MGREIYKIYIKQQKSRGEEKKLGKIKFSRQKVLLVLVLCFLFVMELFFIKSLSKLKKQIFHICEMNKKSFFFVSSK